MFIWSFSLSWYAVLLETHFWGPLLMWVCMCLHLPWSRCPRWRWSSRLERLRLWSEPADKSSPHLNPPPASPETQTDSGSCWMMKVKAMCVCVWGDTQEFSCFKTHVYTGRNIVFLVGPLGGSRLNRLLGWSEGPQSLFVSFPSDNKNKNPCTVSIKALLICYL